MPYVRTCLKPPLSFPSVSGAVCSFDSQYAGIPLKSHVVQLTATQSGSGTPSPDNVRTINGYSAIGISATNNNLWGGNAVVSGVKSAIPTATEVTDYIEFASNAADNGNYFTKSVNFKPNTQYTFIFSIQNPTAIRSNMRVLYDDGTNSNLPNVSDNTKQVMVWTSDANKTILGLVKRNAGGKTRIFYDECCLLEGVHTIDDFEPFGTYTTINLGSTVYGGEYDARTGLLTCKWAKANTSTMNWDISASGLFFSGSLVGIIKNNTSPYTPSPYIKCSAFECVDSSGISGPQGTTPSPNGVFAENTAGVVYFNLTSETTIEGFKAFMSDKQFIYELATPIEIQLPPCPIDTLEGVNNVFADTGDTTLQYIKIGG